jgi:hypothetical protein
MGKVIAIHANCHNPTAKGDFSFAGNLAKDVVHHLRNQGTHDIDVFLVSKLDGIPRFESLYGKAIQGRISIENTSVGVSSLEQFDAIEHTVIAFIDANRCKHSPAALIKRIINPESKFLFVGNVNQQEFSSLFSQTFYRLQVRQDQPRLYDSFSDEDMLIGSAGFGADRFGIPSITKTEELPQLSATEQAMVSQGEYGFMYLALINPSTDYQLIAQYIKLSDQEKYLLIGDFSNKQLEIKNAYEQDTTLVTFKPLPSIEYHQELPNRVMRQTVTQAKSPLILSTGVTSTLEAMQDGKLSYYQDLSNCAQFVAAYLIAVKSLVSSDNGLVGTMPQMLIELSNLLFAHKPLPPQDMKQAQKLLQISSVTSRLVGINQTIIEQANGKVATKLLSFLGTPRKTQDSIQLAHVCASLRRPNQMGSPIHDEALRRAAAMGSLFELKVLIKSMSQSDLNKADSSDGSTALHQAVSEKHFECARALVKAGASLDSQDSKGQTALHKAVMNNDAQMIQMLINAGASIDIKDKTNNKPGDCTPDNEIVFFIQDCHAHLYPK